MAVSWSKGEKHSLNRREHEKIQEKVNNEDLRSGNYSRIQTQFPEAVYDLGCFSTKLKSMGVRDSLDLIIHTPGECTIRPLLAACLPFPSASLNQHLSTKKEKKKEIKTCRSALFKLYVPCFTWRILVPYKTFHWISMPGKVPCPNSSHLHIQRAENPHAIPPEMHRIIKSSFVFSIPGSTETSEVV